MAKQFGGLIGPLARPTGPMLCWIRGFGTARPKLTNGMDHASQPPEKPPIPGIFAEFMMPIRTPRVSIGIPVYNGERFLREALDSLMSQTFGDFNALISDNCSEDSTPEICKEFTSADPRFEYVRQERNLGAVRNFNFVARKATAPLFMWLSHDDVAEPAYLESCVNALDDNPDCVLAFSEAEPIDQNGQEVPQPWHPLSLEDAELEERFELLLDPIPYRENVTYGVIRRERLLKTQLEGEFGGGDRALLCELALHGRFVKVPGVLFRRRVRTVGMTALEVEKYNVGREKAVAMREWRIFFRNLRAVWRSPLAKTHQTRLVRILLKRLVTHRSDYAWEVKQALKSLVTP